MINPKLEEILEEIIKIISMKIISGFRLTAILCLKLIFLSAIQTNIFAIGSSFLKMIIFSIGESNESIIGSVD